MSSGERYGVVVFGATGTTGAVCASYLHEKFSPSGIAWAIAGRNRQKLEQLREKISRESKTDCKCAIIIADCTDASSMEAMTAKARAILTTAGPYFYYGEPVIKACISTGTHYLDITGEVDWVQRMKRKYDSAARKAGVCITNFCGYDCIPAELSVFLANQALGDGYKLESAETVVDVKNMKGIGFPRGTLLTFNRFMGSPISTIRFLWTSFTYIPAEERMAALWSYASWCLPSWSYSAGFTMPNIMGLINIPVVHSSASALGYGGLRLNDRAGIPKEAVNVFTGYGLFVVMMFYGILATGFTLLQISNFFCAERVKRLLESALAPPLKSAMTEITLEGRGTSTTGRSKRKHKSVHVAMQIPGDPGVACTCLLAVETAVALVDKSKTKGQLSSGFHTPVVALTGSFLAKRLQAAGVKIKATTNSGD